jgi:DNA-binding transcriptional LysR family regulator
MDRIDMMRAFRAVAQAEGFAPAARELGISTSALSRQIAALEDWLGSQLFHRTTRQVRLTASGAVYLEQCTRILGSVREMELAAAGGAQELTGTLRITAPALYGRAQLLSRLQGFMRQHPGLGLDLVLIDRITNIVEEGFDLAVRITRPSDSSLIARKIGETEIILAASPEYLARHPAPQRPQDLTGHLCIQDAAGQRSSRWDFPVEGKTVSVPVSGPVKVNQGESAAAFAAEGFGIARLPAFFFQDHLGSGALQEVLPGFRQPPVGIYAVFPPSRHHSPAVRALVDHLVETAKAGATAVANRPETA